MFDFIRRLLQKEQEKEEVDFFALEAYLAEKAWKGLKQEIAELEKIKSEFLRNAEKLEAKDIDAAKVEERAKDVIKGNRNAFVITLRKLVREIELPSEPSSKKIIEFCNTLKESMDDFNKKTARNYFIMKSLIGEELEETRNNLKKADNVLQAMQKTAKQLEIVEDIQQKLRDVYRYLDEKGKRTEELKELEKQAKELMSWEQQVTERINALKTSNEFTELARLKSEFEAKVSEAETVRNSVKSDFSEVARALRKYEKLNPSKLLKAYLEEPCSALEKETGEMQKILHSAAEAVKKHEIDSKNSEKETKKLEELSSKLMEMKDNMIFVVENKEELAKKISDNKLEEQRDKLIEELNSVETKLGETQARLDAGKERSVRQDIEAIGQDLKKAGFDIEVKNAPYE
ncbi:MAG: hypothetical protein KJ955_06985 [Nanoarchaeota archaeon]|nr:hypothetical protein [Nanoarchaeota archaeon]